MASGDGEGDVKAQRCGEEGCKSGTGRVQP